MERKNSIIGVTRNSMLGDITASLITSNLLKAIRPDLLQTAYIDKKCAQIAPFLLNHPNIQEIRISERPDEFSRVDQEYFGQFEYALEPFPQISHPQYFNYHSLHRELLYMNKFLDGAPLFDPKMVAGLRVEDFAPRLTQWFDVERAPKTVAMWTSSGYANSDNSINLRSPRRIWWMDLANRLRKEGYKLRFYGHPKAECYGAPEENRMSLPLFEAIKESLGVDHIVSTDSGVSHIVGAFGACQVVLYSNYLTNHYSNFGAMLPLNWKNNLVAIFGNGGINNIEVEKVIESIKYE